jgi:hypothetical protein
LAKPDGEVPLPVTLAMVTGFDSDARANHPGKLVLFVQATEALVPSEAKFCV